MKRLLIGLALAVTGLFVTVGLASADAGPHGNYSATTDACAGCHRAHTGQAAKLLKISANSLCLSCHDGTGSNLDVFDGALLSATIGSRATGGNPTGITGALRGGGIVFARLSANNTTTPGIALANTVAGVPVTSAHIKGISLNGLTAQNTIWGGGAIGSGAGTSFSLACQDCHNPHGGGTYRILRPIPNGSGTATGVTLTDETTKTYVTPNYWNTYNVGATGTFPAPWTAGQLSSWCATCHTRYLADARAGGTASGDPLFSYRHLSDGTSAITARTGSPYQGTIYTPFCLQCHVSHGSNAQMVGTFSQGVAWPGGAARGNESSLLKIDSRGTCVACHGTFRGG